MKNFHFRRNLPYSQTINERITINHLISTRTLARSSMSTSFPIGSEVMLPSGGTAVLRFVGSVDNKTGIFAGVELLGINAGRGKNSGDSDGKYYFRTETSNSGLFFPYSRIVSANPGLFQETPTRVSRPSMVDRSSSLASRSSPLQLGRAASTGKYSPLMKSKTSQLHLLEAELSKALEENKDLTAQITRFHSEAEEKSVVLSELQALVSETLEPALAESEMYLTAQEEKMDRQRSKFKEQREELLTTIASLQEQAEENNKLYNEQLSQLRATASDSSNPQLEKDDQELKSSLDKVEESSSLEVASLEKRISRLESEVQKKQDEVVHFKSLLKDTEEQNVESQRQIEGLKDEVTQLRMASNSQKNDLSRDSEKEITTLQDTNISLRQELESQRRESESLFIEKNRLIETLEKRVQELNEKGTQSAQVVDGELMVYTPDVKVDASAGREKWCGLCEKQGHDSVECPYETDLMF